MIFVVYCTIGYMKKILLNIAIYIALLTIYLTFTSPALAYVTVGSYYRNNGTYVNSYVRSNPNALRYDNYGYTGGSLYNKTYYTPGYNSSWYTPSYYTDTNYYYGKSLYNSYHSYNSYNSYYSY